MTDQQKYLEQGLRKARAAARNLARCDNASICAVLESLATRTLAAEQQILQANQKDLSRMLPSDPKYDRLLLNAKRLADIAHDLRSVAALPSPVGDMLEHKQLDNGLELSKVRVPMGVIAVIFESRPNVTFDVFALCLKTLNACVLKGSSDAHDTNRVAVRLMHEVLTQHGIDPAVVYLAAPQREYLWKILQATDCIDLAIPRGSRALIDFVRDNARVPVIETGAGVCHVYVHKDATLSMAVDIVVNAKTSRPSVCNAMDTVLIDASIPKTFLPVLQKKLIKKEVVLIAEPKAYRVIKNYPFLQQANSASFDTEYLSLTCAIKLVTNETEAMQHIAAHGTKHSEAIVTSNKKIAEQFLQIVDAAAVYHNASTRFTDGEEFGLGAEVGISTQKLHARGPFALEKLVTEKWILRGSGQIR